MTQVVQIHPERVVEGKRLGAHYKEDERNKDFAFLAKLEAPVPIEPVHWERHIHPMNQNIDVVVDGKTYHGLGSCVVNSMLSAVSTGPFKPPFPHPSEQKTVVPIYETLTHRMDSQYWFPPHDGGTFVLDAMNYAKEQGWISEYRWAYSLDEMLQALMAGPVQIAVGWADSFDHAGEPRFLKRSTGNELVFNPRSEVRGWHAICADQVVPHKQRVWITNQWGVDWCKDGRAFFEYDTLRQLFDTGNIQVAVPVPPVAA